MVRGRTKHAYEILLNKHYAETPREEVMSTFPYRTTSYWLTIQYRNKTMGTYLRRQAPETFSKMYKQWKTNDSLTSTAPITLW